MQYALHQLNGDRMSIYSDSELPDFALLQDADSNVDDGVYVKILPRKSVLVHVWCRRVTLYPKHKTLNTKTSIELFRGFRKSLQQVLGLVGLFVVAVSWCQAIWISREL